MSNKRKLQAMRVTFENGRQMYYFGPAGFDELPKGIASLEFSDDIDLDPSMSVRDLWLLAQSAETMH